jgi:hypothetical protein
MQNQDRRKTLLKESFSCIVSVHNVWGLAIPDTTVAREKMTWVRANIIIFPAELT